MGNLGEFPTYEVSVDRGRHERLGDAVLAAQSAYAESGELPELLSTYHLFGDPALVAETR